MTKIDVLLSATAIVADVLFFWVIVDYAKRSLVSYRRTAYAVMAMFGLFFTTIGLTTYILHIVQRHDSRVERPMTREDYYTAISASSRSEVRKRVYVFVVEGVDPNEPTPKLPILLDGQPVDVLLERINPPLDAPDSGANTGYSL